MNQMQVATEQDGIKLVFGIQDGRYYLTVSDGEHVVSVPLDRNTCGSFLTQAMHILQWGER